MVAFVATPIGNLKDITLRAIETLKEADVVFCEDTRHTLGLLNAYEIKKPLFACHKFNEREAAEKILALSREGKKVAVVSDAGTPVVSDPGNLVCRTLREAGEAYTLIPGPAAFVAALVPFCDEGLQFFSDGRAPMLTDVGIDLLGCVCGMLFAWVVLLIAATIGKRKEKKEEKDKKERGESD